MSKAEQLAQWIDDGALVDDSAEWGEMLDSLAAHLRALDASHQRLKEAAQMGHADFPGLPCGELLAAANVLRKHRCVELAERLEAKHAAEAAALEQAKDLE